MTYGKIGYSKKNWGIPTFELSIDFHALDTKAWNDSESWPIGFWNIYDFSI